jgi:hypothetical protein
MQLADLITLRIHENFAHAVGHVSSYSNFEQIAAARSDVTLHRFGCASPEDIVASAS